MAFPTVGQPENYEEKVLCVMVIDDSASMSGDPIHELNRGLQTFFSEIYGSSRTKDSVEVSILKFGSHVSIERQPQLIAEGEKPPVFTADSGSTSMNAAIQKAIEVVKDRVEYYQKNNVPKKRPWIILLTDGAPTDGDVSDTAQTIEADTKSKKYVFLPIGVKGADMDVLNRLAGYINDRKGGMIKTSALPLESAKFNEFFKWLSHSINQVASTPQGGNVDLTDPASWLRGMTA